MNQFASSPGLNALESLISLVENKAEVKKVIASIRKAQDDANKVIALVGKAQEIDKLHTKARNALQVANERVVTAQHEAEALVEAAVKSAESDQATIRASIADEQADFVAERTKLKSRELKVSARERASQKQMDDAEALHLKATALTNQALAAQAQADGYLALFKETLSQVRQ